MKDATNNGGTCGAVSVKQTDIGTIPNEWEAVELGMVAKVQGGYAFRSAEYRESGVPIVRINNVKDGYIDLSEPVYWTADDLSALSQFVLKEGDIALTMTGVIGNVGMVRPNQTPCFLNQRVARLDIRNSDQLCNHYLFFVARNSLFRNQLVGNAFGAIQQNISSGKIEQTVLPLPPLPEQRTIAAILSKIQQAIEVQEKIIERTKELKKSLMAKLFTEGLHGEELKETEIGLMPKSWKVVRLSDVSERRSETVDPLKYREEIYVGLEHIESGATRLSKYGYASEVRSSKNRFFKGDIIYGKLRPYLDKSVLVNTNGMCSSDILVFTGVRAISQFLVYLVHTNDFLNNAIATTTGVNHPRTSWDAISRYMFGLPSKDEQEEIVTILNSLDDKIEIVDRKVSALKSLFKSMLHQLMTGTIRVNNIELQS